MNNFQSKLVERMQKWMHDKNDGKLYAPLPAHPLFEGWPTRFDRSRFDVLEPYVTPVGSDTALDLGAHWGQFSFFMERHGYRVTAVEHDREHAHILHDLCALYRSNVKIVHGDLLTLPKSWYDVVLAMGVFHFFSRSHDDCDELLRFLRKRITCDVLFMQSYRLDEHSPDTAVLPQAMIEGVSEAVGLPVIECIGGEPDRQIYMLSRL